MSNSPNKWTQLTKFPRIAREYSRSRNITRRGNKIGKILGTKQHFRRWN